MPAGHYRLYVGLYDRQSGARLPVLAPEGSVTADRVLLGDVEVAEP